MFRSLGTVLSLVSSPYNGLLYSEGFLNISKMSTDGGGIPIQFGMNNKPFKLNRINNSPIHMKKI